MMRYIIALFFINTYSRSLGAPAVNPSTASNKITNLLSSLAKDCGNPFIKIQIESTIPNCSNVDHKKIFECLFFYDINNQLCSAINNSKLLIEEDFSPQVKQERNVKDLCDSAKDWTFTDDVKMNLSKIFKDPVKCEKFCGVDDPFSTDSIFICKYYNWGWAKLNSQVKLTLQKLTQNTSLEAVSQVDVPTNVGAIQANISKIPDPNVVNQLLNNSQNELVENKDMVDPQQLPATVSTKDVKNTEGTNAQISSDGSISTYNKDTLDINENTQINNNDNMNLSPDDNGSVEKTPTSAKNNVTSTESQTPVKVDNGSSKLTEDTITDNFSLNNDDDTDDMDDADSNIMGARIISNLSQKDFYDPDMPDNDHFFTFFLTAVVMVILVYILYHNKGKVTKVFLGLIVEGRQNGRRRNSRGHSYRRLDTLEQAMSGNLSAQPSKIIY